MHALQNQAGLAYFPPGKFQLRVDRHGTTCIHCIATTATAATGKDKLTSKIISTQALVLHYGITNHWRLWNPGPSWHSKDIFMPYFCEDIYCTFMQYYHSIIVTVAHIFFPSFFGIKLVLAAEDIYVHH